MDSLKNSDIASEKEAMNYILSLNNDKPIAAQRLFTGKNFKEQVGMFIKDEFGNDRIKIYIDENNEPKFQILEKDGNIIKEFID